MGVPLTQNGPHISLYRLEPTSTADVQTAAPVTITGCLERNEVTFWLKDASIVDLPTSRSWRSGFLKKRSASIAVVDVANKASLRNHVGRRVALTGALVDRAMQMRSLPARYGLLQLTRIDGVHDKGFSGQARPHDFVATSSSMGEPTSFRALAIC